MLRAIVWNELEKVVRRRWLLIAGVAAAVVGIGMSLQLAAPQPADWKTQIRDEISQMKAARAMLQQPPPGMPAGFESSVLATFDAQVSAEQYLLDHGVAPSDWFPAGRAISAILKAGFGFLLLLFGWLAAESITQERADRTLPLLLSRPVSRLKILAGKAIALQAVATAVLVGAMIPVYLVTGLQHGGWGALSARVMVLDDPIKGVIAGNVELVPTWLYLALALALSLAATLVALALGMLASVVARGPGLAVAGTLGGLLLLQPVAAMAKLSLNDPAWLHYTFLPYLAPTTELTSQPAAGLGYSSIGLSLGVLTLWAVVLLAGAMVFFKSRNEV